MTADSGSAANWYARLVRLRGRMRGSLSGTLVTMGAGVPYAIGAKFAHPERPVVALVGDGAMQMNGMADLITIARCWEEWEDPRRVVCVLHNNDALSASRPVVLDVRCDPNMPPIPPHTTFEQAKATAEAMLRGDPDAWDVVRRGVATKVQEFLRG